MYNTPPLDESEMSFYLLFDLAKHSLSTLCTNPLIIYEQLNKAREFGTSAQNEKRNLAKWERRPQDYWGDRFVKERTKESFLEDISQHLAAPLSEHIYDALYFLPMARGRDLFGKKTKQAKEDQTKIKGLLSLLSNK